jgi:putative aminopeptidase FrvX
MQPQVNWRWPLLASLAIAWVGAASAAHAQFRLETRRVIEKRLRSFASDNLDREVAIRKWLAESGCEHANLTEQAVRPGLPPNLICVLPGETQEIVVVGAHTDKVRSAGDGVVDNWSGAALLPSLLFSLNGKKRHHTFMFVGFTAEERGTVGSKYFVAHYEVPLRIAAMVNMDSLGVSPLKVWGGHADKVLLDSLVRIAASSKLPVSTVDFEGMGTTDSESFAQVHIPRITLHSVTSPTMHILHSSDDKLSAIKMDDYYDSYRLIAQYLVYLDDELKPGDDMPDNGNR